MITKLDLHGNLRDYLSANRDWLWCYMMPLSSEEAITQLRVSIETFAVGRVEEVVEVSKKVLLDELGTFKNAKKVTGKLVIFEIHGVVNKRLLNGWGFERFEDVIANMLISYDNFLHCIGDTPKYKASEGRFPLKPGSGYEEDYRAAIVEEFMHG